MMITGAILQATAQSVSQFLGGRALLSFGGGLNNNADRLIVIEHCYPSQRPHISGAYNAFVNVGSIAAAATTFGTFYMDMADQWPW